jgi:glucose/arabinose dehydrogenase
MSMLRQSALAFMIGVVAILASVPAAFGLQSAVEEEPPLSADDSLAELVPVQVAGPFEFPWSLGFLADGSMLVTEKPGRLKLVRIGADPLEIGGVPPVRQGGHGGLLDVAVDPNFARNRTIYLSYTHGTPDASTVRVMKARLDLRRGRLTNRRVVFESDPPAPVNEQLGGRLALTPDGFLFLTLGDRWEPERAQDLADHAGTIVRIHRNGTVPATNPFAAVAGAKPEIWTYGHRNPQGLAFDPSDGRLWSTEHGPQGGDEINVIEPGHNYGWPLVSHGRNYDDSAVGSGRSAAPGIQEPVRVWVPSIAPSGLTVRRDGERHSIWLGALAGQMVVHLALGGGRVVQETRLLEGALGRIRDIRQGPDGFLYILTDDPEGHLYQLLPAAELARRGGSRPPL